MKKIFFFAAIAALALSSCSSDEIVKGDDPVAEGDVVSFSAYTGRANRGTVIGTAAVLASQGGFGVFAYEQDGVDWSKYRTGNTVPNFMYNQNVISSNGTTWTYEPAKYFSNNDGAKHSFFAYAPFDQNRKVVFSKQLTGPAIRYNASDDYDLLWGCSADDDATTAPVDKLKQPVTDGEIGFLFKHALSKVKFDVIYFNDEVHGDDHTEGDNFLDNHTTITVRSVKFVGNVPSQGLLSLYDGTWTYETTEESAYEFVPGTAPTFAANAVANTPVTLCENMMVIPTMKDEKVQIEIVYDVTTIDPEHPKNNSTITNTIRTNETDKFVLEAGKDYAFHLHLGITSVKFTATVKAWTDTDNVLTEEEVDLPNNK